TRSLHPAAPGTRPGSDRPRGSLAQRTHRTRTHQHNQHQGGTLMGSATSGGSIRVAIVGVGNCAASLVQGVHFYRDADPTQKVPGLMHVNFGPYHVRDIEFVAAFDVDAKKVGLDLSQAIVASENNTIKICDVP